MTQRLIGLFIALAIPFLSMASDEDSIKKTYVIIHYGKACEKSVVIKGKYRIVEICGGCCVTERKLRKSRRTKRKIKSKFGLTYY
jgi:hypothetical protein